MINQCDSESLHYDISLVMRLATWLSMQSLPLLLSEIVSTLELVFLYLQIVVLLVTRKRLQGALLCPLCHCPQPSGIETLV